MDHIPRQYCPKKEIIPNAHLIRLLSSYSSHLCSWRCTLKFCYMEIFSVLLSPAWRTRCLWTRDSVGNSMFKDETQRWDCRTQPDRVVLCFFAAAEQTRRYANQEVLFSLSHVLKQSVALLLAAVDVETRGTVFPCRVSCFNEKSLLTSSVLGG